MLIREIMTSKVEVLSPQDSVQLAACRMRDEDVGSVPVVSADRLVGYVTDRDITVRAVAAGREPSTPVSEVMTVGVLACFEDEDVEAVAEKMAVHQVRRLPVLTRANRLCGIVSLGDIATKGADEAAEEALSEISEPPAEREPISGKVG